jgi:DNA polymerase-1
MRNSKNIHVGGLFSFIKTIYKFADLYNIDSIIVFDDSRSLFKKNINTDYKAHRESAPEELLLQKKILIEYLAMVKIPIMCIDNYEADDLIHNYVNAISALNQDLVYIISSDKDLHMLLLLNNVFIIDTNKNILLDLSWLKKEYSEDISREKILLYYALCGDSSDNISGVKGIGDKSARVIIEKYNSLDDLYGNDFAGIKITPRIKKLLNDQKEAAYLSLQLFTPMPMNLDFFTPYFDIHWDRENFLFGNKILLEYECYSLQYKPAKIEDVQVEDEKEKLPYAKDLFVTNIVLNEDDYRILISQIEAACVVALDTETLSGDPRTTQMVGFSVCVEKNSAWYVPLIVNGQRVPLYDLFITIISSINSDKKCIMHNALFDMHVINTLGVSVPKNIFDTMLVAYIFKEIKIGLKELSSKILHEKMNSFSQVMEFGLYKTFDQIEITKAAQYAATDARQTFLLYNHFNALLAQEEYVHFDRLFKEIEMPLLNVLYAMEATGICCDKNVLIHEEIKYTALVNNLHEKIKNIALQYNFLLNPMSNKQTAIFLYEILGLPSSGNNKKTDQISLSAIEHLHEVIPLILMYRSLKSNIAHFTTGLLKYIEHDNRIHTHYQQFATQTGRITTINPNLQNIPRSNDIYKVRGAFCAKDNFLLFSFDYSQIELRILAFFSQDPLLIKLFNENEDIHSLTACMIFKKLKTDITTNERQIAKKINFSIIYGQTAYALSRDLKISLAEAKEYLAIFNSNYIGICNWREKVIADAKEKGYVLTLYGLKRSVPELQDNNKHIFNSGCRIAVNTIIQGTAAEIMKKAMIEVHDYLQKEQCGNIVLQIHDELLIELKEATVHDYAIIIKNKMESIIDDQIKLQVNMQYGLKWI